jgi:3-methyladenine DNA glycosylase AlkD
VTATDVKHALKQLADPERAKSSAWFFKTGPGQYGEGDQFIGVTVPEQRKVARQFRELPLPEIERLLASPIHEHRLTALLILVDQFQRSLQSLGSTRRVEPREYVDFYLTHRDRVNNWDLVDSSASQILGQYLVAPVGNTSEVSRRRLLRGERDRGELIRRRRVLDKLARSRSLWDRRIAIVATQAFIQAGQFAETLRLAGLLLRDPEDLIHKATGWMLREVGKRDEAALCRFLDAYAASMPRTMLRYAIEKLPESTRTRYLALK